MLAMSKLKIVDIKETGCALNGIFSHEALPHLSYRERVVISTDDYANNDRIDCSIIVYSLYENMYT